jgi:glycerophosphoryl diester phosphodiesterase
MSVGCPGRRAQNLDTPWLIAHAGGVARSRTYTNSLEALNYSAARGFQLIELDFSWTRDGYLVLLHDWNREFENLFDHPSGQLTLAEFRNSRSKLGLTQLALPDLGEWMDRNPGIRVITDVKNRNLDGLGRIATRLSRHMPRFLPQIYHPEEYSPVRALGYRELIFTLYRCKLSDDEVMAFATSHDLHAVAMTIGRATGSDLMMRLHRADIPVLVHTVNDLSTLMELTGRGASGIFTDWLIPREVYEATAVENRPRSGTHQSIAG